MSSPAKVTRPTAAGKDVEAGRLAGAVRAHDPRQTPFLERERKVLQDDLVAEALVQAGRFKEGHGAPPGRWPECPGEPRCLPRSRRRPERPPGAPQPRAAASRPATSRRSLPAATAP